VRRKRRTKYTWFPTIGTDLDIAGAPDDVVSGQQITTVVLETGESQVDIFPVTIDEPKEGTDLLAADTLSTVIGNEYILRRIVGKFFASMQPKRNVNGDPSTPQACLLGLGFFVARAADSAQNSQQPIGSATIGERRQNYSPLSTDCIREPWIWRRTWILTNPAFAALVTDPTAQQVQTVPLGFPTSTSGYGSVADGPHIDAKTIRRIRQDERLWVSLATIMYPLGTTTDQASLVVSYLDFRLLGQLRRAKNSGAF